MTIYVAEVDSSNDWCGHEAKMTLCIYCGVVLAVDDEDVEITMFTSNKNIYKDIGAGHD